MSLIVFMFFYCVWNSLDICFFCTIQGYGLIVSASVSRLPRVFGLVIMQNVVISATCKFGHSLQSDQLSLFDLLLTDTVNAGIATIRNC